MHSWRKPIIIFVVGISVALGVGSARAGILSINPSEGTTLAGSGQFFSWTGTGITEYWLYVGTTQGAKDIHNSKSLGTATSDTANGLPTDGSTVWVRLWHREGGTWLWKDFSYTAFTASGGGRLSAVPPWDQNLPGAKRFVLVLPTRTNPAGAGVLDKETGLVWERSAGTVGITWSQARRVCVDHPYGDRFGWRLPSVQELGSLLHPLALSSSLFAPDLAPGHPFINVKASGYWSATTNADIPEQAWIVNFGDVGDPHVLLGGVELANKTGSHPRWCVRGGGPLSVY